MFSTTTLHCGCIETTEAKLIVYVRCKKHYCGEADDRKILEAATNMRDLYAALDEIDLEAP